MCGTNWDVFIILEILKHFVTFNFGVGKFHLEIDLYNCKLQSVISAACVTSNNWKFDSLCHGFCMTNYIADVSMSFWSSSAVPDEQLHTNSRRRQSSTPAIRQSAEIDRSSLSTGQL